MKSKVLVTGGMGYIGSHTVVVLIEAGFEVVIVDDLSNSRIEVLDRIEQITRTRPAFHQFDLCDIKKLRICVDQEKNISSVIHFAAFKAVGESQLKPLEYYQNNLLSTLNLLTVMREKGVNNIVFSSSCTVYGQPDKLPVTESSPFKPAESTYGQTKQMCEYILRDTVRANEMLNCISLRYFNPVGAHESALIGELPLGVPANLVPFITQTAIGLREELSVFGTDYKSEDGTAVRDYIHVVDLAKAHLVAMERLLDKKNKANFEFFNIGTGNGYSVLQVVNTFQEVNQVKVNHKLVDRRAGDVEIIYADTHLANNELGWKAEKGLEEMLGSAWKWEQAVNSSE